MSKPFQRIGSTSNAQVGREFEIAAKKHFARLGVELSGNLKIAIGIGALKKDHAFDLGSEKEKIIVECKSHKWTSPNDNVPSAKLTVWNEAMYYFHISPNDFRKIFFVLRDFSRKRNETLAEYYVRTSSHLIPRGVEIWEFDEENEAATQLPLNKQLQPDAANSAPLI